MPDPGSDFFADLTTDPIFDDAVYLSEALLLPVDENEDHLDSQLTVAAREAGIEDPYRYLCPDIHDISTSISTISLQSEHRSSMSMHSRETQSTGITSQPSRTSRDNPYREQSPVFRSPPPLARASLSLDRNDYANSRFPHTVRHRHSSLTFSAANSLLSGASSPRKPAARKHKRGSGLFSMFRKDSNTCPSRSHHGQLCKPESPKLKCGHSLSKYAIGVHIQEALDSKENVAPSCCGQPLPKEILQLVITSEEVDVVGNSTFQSPDLASLRDSGYSEDGISSIDLSNTLDGQPLRTDSFTTTPNTPNQETHDEDAINLTLAFTNEAFEKLKGEQKVQFMRVSAFESNQRKALSAHHQWHLKRLSSELEATKSEKTKQHTLELERLDEFQIVAEHDLRKAQATETQNVATALKYMDAYCSGTNPSNPELAHTVTDDDLKKLERQRMMQQRLPFKHEAAINVLRAKQERDAKLKLQKQQNELHHLDTQHEKDRKAEELQYVKDSSRLDTIIQARRRRMILRWDLKFEIWRKEWETQHAMTLPGRILHEDWPENTNLEEPINPSSSLALYTLVVA